MGQGACPGSDERLENLELKNTSQILAERNQKELIKTDQQNLSDFGLALNNKDQLVDSEKKKKKNSERIAQHYPSLDFAVPFQNTDETTLEEIRKDGDNLHS